MHIARLPALAACLSIGSLAAWAACGGTLDAAAAVLAPAAAVASQCQTLPAPSSGATPAASASGSSSPATAASAAPADLCVSVQASQASIQAGQAGTWTVQVWTQNGPVTGVTVTLTGTGGQPTFAGKCPSGDGSASCAVGDLATDVAASSYQMQAQITVPSGTAAGSSVTLFRERRRHSPAARRARRGRHGGRHRPAGPREHPGVPEQRGVLERPGLLEDHHAACVEAARDQTTGHTRDDSADDGAGHRDHPQPGQPGWLARPADRGHRDCRPGQHQQPAARDLPGGRRHLPDSRPADQRGSRATRPAPG